MQEGFLAGMRKMCDLVYVLPGAKDHYFNIDITNTNESIPGYASHGIIFDISGLNTSFNGIEFEYDIY